ncbi:MAG: hypothetical protein NT126_10855 [Bacteroidetes bacterium]|nr:hypothetical protein [Bacteroidota bacterium]
MSRIIAVVLAHEIIHRIAISISPTENLDQDIFRLPKKKVLLAPWPG